MTTSLTPMPPPILYDEVETPSQRMLIIGGKQTALGSQCIPLFGEGEEVTSLAPRVRIFIEVGKQVFTPERRSLEFGPDQASTALYGTLGLACGLEQPGCPLTQASDDKFLIVSGAQYETKLRRESSDWLRETYRRLLGSVGAITSIEHVAYTFSNDATFAVAHDSATALREEELLRAAEAAEDREQMMLKAGIEGTYAAERAAWDFLPDE